MIVRVTTHELLEFEERGELRRRAGGAEALLHVEALRKRGHGGHSLHDREVDLQERREVVRIFGGGEV